MTSRRDITGFRMVPGLVNIQKTIENGPVEIVDFPTKNGDVIG